MRPFIKDLAKMAVSLDRHQKTAVFLSVDVILVPLSLILTIAIVGDRFWLAFSGHPNAFFVLTLTMSLTGMIASKCLRLPAIKLNAYEQDGMMRTAIYAVLVGLAGLITTYILLGGQNDPRTMLNFTMILAILSVSSRFSMRVRTDDAVVPVAFVDDNVTLHNVIVAGLPVLPPMRIEKLIEEYQIDRVVLAMPSISRPQQIRLARKLKGLQCEVSALPSFAQLVGEGELVDQIQSLNVSDLLGRDGLENEMGDRNGIYSNRVVMITGAGGSIGSELARQLQSCEPSKIILFERSEHALYQIHREMVDLGVIGPQVNVKAVLGSVTDENSVRHTVQQYGVEIILHAAAYKHVPLVEENKLVGLENNVLGTRIVADVAQKAETVSHFIFVSTDKAVNPKNVMGASKRLAELLVQDIASRSLDTNFGIVRFGNVLGSSGSVVPLFEEQIRRGGPITLSHRDVTRYFMTISEASRLVLLAGNFTCRDDPGDVFVLDMGKPVSIHDLATQMIESAGYSVRDENNPDGDIEIELTGLRPGEKLHEDLLLPSQLKRPTAHPKITRIHEDRLSEIEIAGALRMLVASIKDQDDQAAMEVLQRWVQPSSLEAPQSTGKSDTVVKLS